MSEIEITEALRFDWKSLRAAGSAEQIPGALKALTSAETVDAADAAYWKIDNTVVVQGSLYEAAEATVPCVLQALLFCTDQARPKLLELLFQLGGGTGDAHPSEIEKGNSDLRENCRVAVKSGLSQFFFLLEKGSAEESGFAADLVELCAENDTAITAQAKWWLKRLSDQTADPKLAKIYRDCLKGIQRPSR